MYYQLYADSLFLLNFTLNLYLFLLLNKSLNRTATWVRLLIGALWSGAGYCMMFLLPLPAILKILFAVICVSGGSLVFVFRPSNVRSFVKLTEKLFLYAFIIGGSFLLLMNHVKAFRNHMMSVTGVLACGGLITLVVYAKTGKAKKEAQRPCMVELHKGEVKIRLQGLVDTGNSLVEPISGKPVSVIDKDIFEQLWDEEELLSKFRIIPYRSVGCENGIMKGYEIPEIIIAQDGIRKVCRNSYLGISERKVSSEGTYQILVHPEVLQS